MSIKTVRYVLWGAVAVAAIGVGVGYLGLGQNGGIGTAGQTLKLKAASGSNLPSIGGPFELVEMTGAPVTQQDLMGRKHAVFFGYTNCPDVCPLTLQELTAALSTMPADEASELDIVFISVDHERDTPEFLNDYLSVFESPARIRGFTGTKQQIADAAKQYRVFYQKVVSDDGDVLYDHSSSTYLFDETGNFEGTIAFQEKPSVVVEKLRNLVAS
ncbi:MAG: SCO family protein [Pseudomonadota bacterium]